MSLGLVLSNAISGLNTAQTSMRVISDNIANVNTPNFARAKVEQASRALNGVGAGVEVTEIRRIVDDFLNREFSLSTASAAQYESLAKLHDNLQSLLGDPADNNSLSGKIDTVFKGLASLPSDPSSSVLRQTVVADLESMAREFTRLADQMQKLRAEADRQIALDTADANDLIGRIYDLNNLIVSQAANGTETAGLEEQRDQALQKLSKLIDVRSYPIGNGRIAVATLSGVTLVDTVKREIQYESSGTVFAGARFNQITVHEINPVTGAVSATGQALDTAIRGGSIRGWLDMRDTELTSATKQIGTLAASVMDELNAIHNQNISVPPPAKLTGNNTGLVSTDPHGFTGKATFYAFDSNNAITNSVTIDFGTLTTLADVISAVNTGLGGDATLALTNGVMTLTAGGSASGVGIEQDATSPSSRGGRGFSHFFGMNDLLSANVKSFYDTGVAAGDPHRFTGTAMIEFRGANNDVLASSTLDFSTLGATFNDILTQLNSDFSGYATFSLSSAGELVMTPASGYETYNPVVVTDNTDRGGTGLPLGQFFGIGTRYTEEAAREMIVRSDIAADGNKLALARVDTGGPPALTPADDRGARDFQGLATKSFLFGAVGGLPAVNATLADYSAQILGYIGARAAQVESIRNDRVALRDEIGARREEVSGVNLDEELALMIQIQNAYNAAARMVSTAQEMFDTLINV